MLSSVSRKLARADGRYYPPDVEQQITTYLNECQLELHPTANADEADDLELEIIAKLQPLLNVSRSRRRRPAAPT